MRFLISGFLSVLFLFSVTSVRAAGCFDHSVWEKIVEANVDEDGYVDYYGVGINKGGNLIEYLTFLEIFDISKCAGVDKKIFWINAYNANVVRRILDSGDLDQLSEQHSVYTKRVEFAGKRMSLNKVFHRVIRSDATKGGPVEKYSLKKFDPRLHFVLSHGVVGSAKLQYRVYDSENFNETLNNAAINYVNDKRYIRIEEGKLVMSELFLRYAVDFKDVGGVVTFVSNLTDVERRSDADEIDAKLKADFPGQVTFIYDWTVNDQKKKDKKE